MRSSVYEQALEKSGVKFSYEEKIPLDEINIVRGRQTQARLIPIDENLVESYKEMIEEGFEPPPIVVFKPPRSKYVPIDGNQRLAANERAKKHKKRTWDAYVIETEDPMIIDRVCWTFNNLVNGRRLSYEECMEHAIVFAKKYGLSQEQAAKEWGVKRIDLNKRIVEIDMRELAAKHKVEIPDAMPVTTIVTLSPLRRIGDDVAAKALEAAASTGIGLEDTQDLVVRVRDARTHEQKMKVIEEFVEDPKVQQRAAETQQGRRRPSPPPRVELQRWLDHGNALLQKFKDKKAFKPQGKADVDNYRAIARQVANQLIEIYGLGALLQGEVA